MEVYQRYDRIAEAYDASRSRHLMERPYLEQLADLIGPGVHILDLGCGMGEPIARYFLERGYAVTGVDAAKAMITLCRRRLAQGTWLLADMRNLSIGVDFDAVIAWGSFFHLGHEEQRAMFKCFARCTRRGGALLFTSGTEHGEVTHQMHGEPIYHASLDAGEYRRLLDANGFETVRFSPNDPECGAQTVWLARRMG